MEDKEVSSTKCYICHKNLKKKIKWHSLNNKHYHSISYCDVHGFIKYKVRLKKSEDKNKKKLSNKSAVVVKSDAMKDTKKAEAERKEFVLPELQYDADDVVKCVYNCFSNKPITIDNLVKLSGIKISDVMYAVTDLEINGVIESLPGGMFKIM